jgi:hypothetical protein
MTFVKFAQGNTNKKFKTTYNDVFESILILINCFQKAWIIAFLL